MEKYHSKRKFKKPYHTELRHKKHIVLRTVQMCCLHQNDPGIIMTPIMASWGLWHESIKCRIIKTLSRQSIDQDLISSGEQGFKDFSLRTMTKEGVRSAVGTRRAYKEKSLLLAASCLVDRLNAAHCSMSSLRVILSLLWDEEADSPIVGRLPF